MAKRSASNSPDRDDHRNKRANIANADNQGQGVDDSDEVSVRWMIPASVAGAIIGKKGETLKQIKNETGCHIKMSRNEDGMYPTTMERVLNARGCVSSVGKLAGVLINRVNEKLDQNHAPDQFDHKNTSRQQEVKFIVPNTSAGMVIGKAGTSIKEIREKTGVSIQVFPKAGTIEAQRSVERVITVSSPSFADLEAACLEIVRRIAGDPQHNNGPDFFNPSQTAAGSGPHHGGQGGPPGLGGPGGPHGPPPLGMGGYGGPGMPPGRNDNFGGQGGPYNNGPPPQQGPPPNMYSGGGPQGGRYGNDFDMGKPQHNSRGDGGSRFNPLEGVANNDVMQFLDSLQMTLRTSGFNESAVSEVMNAMQVLAKYNIMGLGLGLGVAAMASLRGQGAVLPQPASIQQDSAAATAAIMLQAQQQQQATAVVDNFNTAQAPPNISQSMPMDYAQQQQMQQQQMKGDLVPSQPTMHTQAPPPNTQTTAAAATAGAAATNAQAGNFAASVIKQRMGMDPNKLELEIPAPIVTAVLSSTGKTLEEVRRLSGTAIDASQRAADPTYRLVIIKGERENVSAAKVMIERAINDEQARRQRLSAF